MRATSRAGSGRRPGTAGARSRRSSTSAPRSCTACRCTSPTAPARSPASRRRSVRRASTSRTSSSTTYTPERGGTIELLVAGAGRRRARRRAARRAGLRRAGSARPGGCDVSTATGSGRLDVAPAAALVGEIAVPGDKSISHRALLIGAVSDGTTEVTRLRRQRRHARHARRRRAAGCARRAPRRGRHAPARPRLRPARPARAGQARSTCTTRAR